MIEGAGNKENRYKFEAGEDWELESATGGNVRAGGCSTRSDAHRVDACAAAPYRSSDLQQSDAYPTKSDVEAGGGNGRFLVATRLS